MTDLLLPVGIVAASLAMTYLFCVRPMRQRRCVHPGTERLANDELDRALQQARTEVERLRAQVTGRASTRPDLSRQPVNAADATRFNDHSTGPTEG